MVWRVSTTSSSPTEPFRQVASRMSFIEMMPSTVPPNPSTEDDDLPGVKKGQMSVGYLHQDVASDQAR
jgi:hypothetical protein